MGIVNDIKGRYEEMDEIDRKNFWIAVFFGVVIILLIINLTGTFGVLGGLLGKGSSYVNQSISGAQDLGGNLGQ